MYNQRSPPNPSESLRMNLIRISCHKSMVCTSIVGWLASSGVAFGQEITVKMVSVESYQAWMAEPWMEKVRDPAFLDPVLLVPFGMPPVPPSFLPAVAVVPHGASPVFFQAARASAEVYQGPTSRQSRLQWLSRRSQGFAALPQADTLGFSYRKR